MAPRSIVIATDIDVLPLDRVIVRRGEYTVIRSPSNPAHYWGNFLLFDEPPDEGAGERWEGLFQEEFGDEPRIRHRAFTWDRVDGALGRAREEFPPRGYSLDETVGLVATRRGLQPHPRANTDVVVRALDADGDAELWAAVVELQVEGRDEGHEEQSYEEQGYRDFVSARLADHKAHFRAGCGAWYVALDPSVGAVTASCGIVVTAGRGRYQVVETAAPYRRLGIASRLLVDAARLAADGYGAEQFVIAADANYHALGLYESLGFARQERLVALTRRPP
jgi:ribosomal protein S18 acetylase RimI-like enzyme